MKIAQILHDKVHWIFEEKEIPNWPPDPEGNPIVLIDITDKPEVQEGWEYNKETGEFTEPEYIPPEPEPVPPTQLDIIENMIIENALDTDFRFTMIEMSLGIE